MSIPYVWIELISHWC